jgi:hypothetical protein
MLTGNFTGTMSDLFIELPRRVVFSETHMQSVASLFVRTGARRSRDEQGYRLLGKGYWTGSQRREDVTERLTGARRAPVLVAAVLGS